MLEIVGLARVKSKSFAGISTEQKHVKKNEKQLQSDHVRRHTSSVEEESERKRRAANFMTGWTDGSIYVRVR